VSLRLYEESEAGPDGYPFAWHEEIKHWVREHDGHRCLRCGHPYIVGQHAMELDLDGTYVSWSRCDLGCVHGGPVRLRELSLEELDWHEIDLSAIGTTAREAMLDVGPLGVDMVRFEIEARARILTVHHLDGVKLNCRWWNLVSLCQRCHLHIQKKVDMLRVFPFEHTDWFKPYAAGWYAFTYLGEDLDRGQTMERLDELLALERIA
jgi:hypothetical protein